ncbi:hypothetical protein MTX26_01145 [Bradyrhizobium sp. ISRA443]|uniref:hypothetical protein n=1 Tax=unclassified Bradyrhizobium TaxID=2631580 RepID=UPI0024796217|nr:MULTISPECIES: hypothetical protein [unclassified Bradyrhizobium]WGR94696.1 hypothetical protein MTX20_11165 [Bradyrhizobium sp. ISRA435]WGR99511.1 hypothetical protein MTX23_01145 [Bradyrhizobium sp. ISRA436]WGS06401.1 hypothetical protein MTX18_01145 [Bradyrhizobium sp. ISRA437]WGS13285.1 hypothetical protein MTX26_01145 [Bradyrhizobium sp. ISRA443]
MRDYLLQGAGVIAIIISLIHGVLGELRIFARATVEPPRLRLLLRLVWQAGTVAWIGGGVLLVVAPAMASDAARHWIVATLAVVFGCAALANAIATRGRHFGWIGMSVVVALAIAGY